MADRSKPRRGSMGFSLGKGQLDRMEESLHAGKQMHQRLEYKDSLVGSRKTHVLIVI